MNGLFEAFLSLLYPEDVACCICGEEACVNEEGLCASCAAGIRRCTLPPALRFADGKVWVDDAQCVGCGLCMQTCGFKAIEEGEA